MRRVVVLLAAGAAAFVAPAPKRLAVLLRVKEAPPARSLKERIGLGGGGRSVDVDATPLDVPEGGEAPPAPEAPTPISRTLRLRDSVWARQAMDDLVAAEFALRLSGDEDESGSFVDFERLREQLDNRIDELDAGAGSSKIGASDKPVFRARARDMTASLADAARRAARRRYEPNGTAVEAADAPPLGKRARVEAMRAGFLKRADAVAELSWLALRGPPKDAEYLRNNLSAVLYVRQDGSVDWEGALQGAKAATAFSVDLWKRINGVGERSAAGVSAAANATAAGGAPDGSTAAPTDDVPGRLSGARQRAAQTARERREASLLARARAAVYATKALVDARATVDRVVEEADEAGERRSRFRVANKDLQEREGDYVAARLELALERACAALEAALDASTEPIDLRDRRFVAEFALLDAQLTALGRDASSVGVAILLPEFEMLGKEIRDFSGRLGVDRFNEVSAFYESLKNEGVDESDLLLIFDEAQLGRLSSNEAAQPSSLGLLLRTRAAGGGPVAAAASNLLSSSGAVYDAAGAFAANLRQQCAKGFAFYADGTRLLAADVAFCTALVGRAFSGETLVPRDVRVFRRTLKDLATTVPFVIILLIPLSPVGHVFVFGAIQRFFPDFFPSCYTERRQNLVKLYASAELDRLPERKKPGADTIFKL